MILEKFDIKKIVGSDKELVESIGIFLFFISFFIGAFGYVSVWAFFQGEFILATMFAGFASIWLFVSLMKIIGKRKKIKRYRQIFAGGEEVVVKIKDVKSVVTNSDKSTRWTVQYYLGGDNDQFLYTNLYSREDAYKLKAHGAFRIIYNRQLKLALYFKYKFAVKDVTEQFTAKSRNVTETDSKTKMAIYKTKEIIGRNNLNHENENESQKILKRKKAEADFWRIKSKKQKIRSFFFLLVFFFFSGLIIYFIFTEKFLWALLAFVGSFLVFGPAIGLTRLKFIIINKRLEKSPFAYRTTGEVATSIFRFSVNLVKIKIGDQMSTALTNKYYEQAK